MKSLSRTSVKGTELANHLVNESEQAKVLARQKMEALIGT